jgi:hypothetical protein
LLRHESGAHLRTRFAIRMVVALTEIVRTCSGTSGFSVAYSQGNGDLWRHRPQ